ncbi:hypothetical protein [Luteolibacter sp. Populi]|uniref:hypothetical protein n=1 Tax=Luteolibacter sp. Populi TaxID=3230487 RepID=UPI0034677273
MITRPKLALLLCLAVLLLVLWVCLGIRPGKVDEAGSRAGRSDRGSLSPRPEDDMEARIAEAIAEYKKSERPKYSDAAPYHLSAAEIEKFLQARGRSVSSLYFALLCSGDRRLLDEIAALPDSPLKFQILAAYTTDKGARLERARKYVEFDPDNRIAHLMLSYTLSELGLPDEALEVLQKSSAAPDIRSGRDDIAAEFKAGCGILGEERGYQMLELHWSDYAVNVALCTAGGYLASLDPAPFIRNGEADVPLMLGKMDDFYRRIGFDEDRRREDAMMKVRDSIVRMKTTNGITNASFEFDRLNRELNAEFIAGFKRATAFDKLTPAQRNQRLAENYLSGF